MQQLQPTIREFDLPREPFLRLIECNRIDQRKHEYDTWDEVEWYCDHSADPVGRLVLGLLRRADDEELVRASDDVCTGLQLVNFLQDVPRDLELGRIYLPAEDRRRYGVTVLDRPNEPLTHLLRFEAERARGLLARRAAAPGADRRADRAGGRASSRGAGSPRSTRSRTPAGTSSPSGRGRRGCGSRGRRSGDEGRGGVRGGRAADARAGAELRLRDQGAAEGEAARDLRDLRLRARGRRHRRRRRAAGREARAAGGASPAPRRAAGRRGDVGRARRRPRAVPDPGPGAARLRRRRADGPRPAALRHLRRAARLLRARRGRGRGRVHRRVRRRPAAAGGDARDRAPADQHHARREGGLGARAGLPPAGRARRARRRRGRHPRRAADPGVAVADGLPGRPGARLPRGRARTLLGYLDHRSSACVGTFAGLYRATLERIEERGFDVFDGKPQLSTATKLRIVAPTSCDSRTSGHGCGLASPVPRLDERVRRRQKVAVVGGGLAGSRQRSSSSTAGTRSSCTRRGRRSAARCRRCRSGRATRRRRPTTASTSGSAASPSGSGSSARIGKAGAIRREPLRLPVIDERGPVGDDRAGPAAARLLAPAARLACPDRPCGACASGGQTPSAVSDRTFADVLGARPEEIDRFWDVFIRPALNLPTARGRRRLRGLHRPDRAPRRRAAPPTCCCRSSRSARCTAPRPAARSATASASSRGSSASTTSTPTP